MERTVIPVRAFTAHLLSNWVFDFRVDMGFFDMQGADIEWIALLVNKKAGFRAQGRDKFGAWAAVSVK
jgi:hypothetical protein